MEVSEMRKNILVEKIRRNSNIGDAHKHFG